MFKLIENLVLWAAKASFFFGALAMVFMMSHIGGDVFARTFFGSSLPGTLEVTAEWYMIAIVYMPLALVTLRNQHISVDLFTHGLREKTQHWLRVMTSLAALVFFYYWADASLSLAFKKTKRLSYLDSGLLHIPTWPVYWACFVAIVLLRAATVIVLVRAVMAARKADETLY